MNSELQKEMAAWLDQLRVGMTKGTDFVLTQAPLVVQEKIRYGRVVETVWLGIYLTCSLVLLYAAIRLWKHVVKQDDGELLPAPLVVTALTMGVFLGTMYQFEQTMQVWFAPRLYIIEWLAELMKKAS